VYTLYDIIKGVKILDNENFESTIIKTTESQEVSEIDEMNNSNKEGTHSELDNSNMKYEGIGGWLILVILGLSISAIKIINMLITVYYPLFSNGTIQSLSNPTYKYYSKILLPTLTMEMIYNTALVFFVIITLVFIFLKKKYVPKMMIAIYLSGLIFNIIDHILVLKLPFVNGVASRTPNGIVSSIIVCSIWIPYFIKSERVKNTFIK
jgi:hypothetical protein